MQLPCIRQAKRIQMAVGLNIDPCLWAEAVGVLGGQRLPEIESIRWIEKQQIICCVLQLTRLLGTAINHLKLGGCCAEF